MFLLCPIKQKKCAFCGEYKNVLYCGIAKQENRIEMMNKCPYKPRKR
tara:strand:+ start:2543 stop:2683 length:141 start_codon:yes stop_codon:yes gene_type:complete